MAKKSKLTKTLETMLLQAKTNESEAVQRKLGHGLRLSVRFRRHPPQFRLALSRPDVYPSDQELETVLKHWPEKPTNLLSPTNKTQFKGSYWLSVDVMGNPKPPDVP